MSYLTYDLEKSFVISYDELSKQVVDLEYNKAHWPAQFSADQERELANYLQGRAIVGSWLEEVPESQVTMRKTRGAIRQLATLIDILKENPNNPVTANQGLCVTDYIYVHVAKIIDSSFYSFAYSTSHPTFKRSPASDFDHTDLSQYLGQVLKNLNKGQYSNYILLEEAMSTCVTSIVAMRKTAYAAGFNG